MSSTGFKKWKMPITAFIGFWDLGWKVKDER
jgi:hypothetical protein